MNLNGYGKHCSTLPVTADDEANIFTQRWGQLRTYFEDLTSQGASGRAATSKHKKDEEMCFGEVACKMQKKLSAIPQEQAEQPG